MNEMSIKPTAIVDAPSNNGSNREKTDKAAALAALAGSFKELVHQVGTNVDTGLSSIAERRGITAVSESREPSQQFDDNHGEQPDDYDHQQVARGREDDHGERRGDNGRDDQNDHERHAPQAGARDDLGTSRDNGETDVRDDNLAEKSSQSDRPANDDRRNDNQSNAGDEADSDTADTGHSENNGQNNANTDSNQPKNGPQVADVAAAAAQATAPEAGLNAAQMLAQNGAQALSDDAEISDTAKISALSGIAAGATSSAKGAGVHGAEAGRQQQTGTQAQVQASANGQGQNQADTATKGQSNIQQQAQQMARALGDNARMQVNVNVADEADTLTSRPTATLAAGVALAADAKGQTQGNQQGTTHAAAPGQAQAALTTPGQTQGGQGQGQNAQANAQGNQAQVISQAGADAKGPAAASSGPHANAGPASSAAGGEGSSTSGNVTGSAQSGQTQQTQQAQQAQQAAQARGPRNGPSAAEQVSVRITRAIQAGNDKISIRLNPAELGRVEVKMELAHDGRMTAVVTADNKDTLDLLKRDASQLQKALEEGGLDLDSGNLAFNLRGEDGETADGGDGNTGMPGDAEEQAEVESADTEPDLILTPQDVVLGDGRIDVKA